MTYRLDSQGEVIHCERCGCYPSSGLAEVRPDEWLELCPECHKAAAQPRPPATHDTETGGGEA